MPGSASDSASGSVPGPVGPPASEPRRSGQCRFGRGAWAEYLRLALVNIPYYLVFAVWTLFCLLLYLAELARCRLFGCDVTPAYRRLNSLYGRGWRVLVRPWVKVSCNGLEAAKSPCIVVANHLSFYDVFCMANLPQSNLVFTVRRWPFQVPVYGAMMRLSKYIDVESQGYSEVLKEAEAEKDGKAIIIFFPEGHRSRDGKLQRFHSGAFLLAMDLNIPILPVKITGGNLVTPAGSLLLRPGEITLQGLSMLYPEDFLKEHSDPQKARKALGKKTRDMLESV